MRKSILILLILPGVVFKSSAQDNFDLSQLKLIEVDITKSGEVIKGVHYLISLTDEGFDIIREGSFYVPPNGNNEFPLFKKLDQIFFNDKSIFFTNLKNGEYDSLITKSKYSKDNLIYFYLSRLRTNSQIRNVHESKVLKTISHDDMIGLIDRLVKAREINTKDKLLKLIELNPQWIKLNKNEIKSKYLEGSRKNCFDNIAQFSDADLQVIANYLFTDNPFSTSIEKIDVDIKIIFNHTSDDLLISWTLKNENYTPIIIAGSESSYNIFALNDILSVLRTDEILGFSGVELDEFYSLFFSTASKISCN